MNDDPAAISHIIADWVRLTQAAAHPAATNVFSTETEHPQEQPA